MIEEKNYNPTGKDVFVLYECPNCGRNDCSCVPPKMKVKIPFFVTCDCGGYVMYQKAWVIEPPLKAMDVLIAWVSGDRKIIDELKPGGKFKEVTDKLDPDGLMMDGNVMLQDPEFIKEAERRFKDRESKEVMFR